MPRPMVPAPATAATRSLRETSSMGGESGYSSGRRGGYNRHQEEAHEFNPEARGHGGAARRSSLRLGAVLSFQADHADLSLARGWHDRRASSKIRGNRPEIPRPAGRG